MARRGAQPRGLPACGLSPLQLRRQRRRAANRHADDQRASPRRFAGRGGALVDGDDDRQASAQESRPAPVRGSMRMRTGRAARQQGFPSHFGGRQQAEFPDAAAGEKGLDRAGRPALHRVHGKAGAVAGNDARQLGLAKVGDHPDIVADKADQRRAGGDVLTDMHADLPQPPGGGAWMTVFDRSICAARPPPCPTRSAPVSPPARPRRR